MRYKKDSDILAIQVEILKRKYKFRGLFHFTDFSNLRSIFKSGKLSSRTYCKNNNIEFIDGADHSVLDRASEDVHNCVRFYYRPKTPTLYENEGIKLEEFCNSIHIPIPVYLIFNEELIYLNNTKFSNGNATNSPIGNDLKFFVSMDWENIFHDTWFNPEERDYIINKRQAELLSLDDVPLKYLKEIVFRCDTDLKRAINIFGYNEKYRVDIRLFSDKNFREPKKESEKNNFIKNYNLRVIVEENTIELDIEYNKEWNNYKTKLDILDENNNSIIRDFKGIVWYEDRFGRKIITPSTYLERKCLRIEGNLSNCKKIMVYLNNNVCIEEYLYKYYIRNFHLSFKVIDNKINLLIHKEFINVSVLNKKHKVEFLDSSNKKIYSTYLNYGKNPTGLNWITTLKDYNVEWKVFNYYINDVLCISDNINNCIKKE